MFGWLQHSRELKPARQLMLGIALLLSLEWVPRLRADADQKPVVYNNAEGDGSQELDRAIKQAYSGRVGCERIHLQLMIGCGGNGSWRPSRSGRALHILLLPKTPHYPPSHDSASMRIATTGD